MSHLTALQRLGIAKEAVWGTPIAAKYWVPTKTPKGDTDIKRIVDEGKRGIAAKDFGSYAGTRLGRLELDGDFYPDVPPIFLLGALGAEAVAATASTTIGGAGALNAGSTVIPLPGGAPAVTAGQKIYISDGANSEYATIQTSAAAGAGSWTITVGTTFSHALGTAIQTGPWTHTFTLNADPPSFTLSDFNGVNERQYAGAMVESLDLKFATDSGALEYATKLLSKASTVISNTTATYGTLPPLLGWQSSLKIAGVSNLRMLGGEVSLKRTLKELFGANNSQDPSRIWSSILEVTGKLTFDMPDEVELNNYLNTTQPSVEVIFAAGDYSLSVLMTKCDFEKATPDRSQELVRLDASIRALYNVTDVGPAKVTVKNNTAVVF